MDKTQKRKLERKVKAALAKLPDQGVPLVKGAAREGGLDHVLVLNGGTQARVDAAALLGAFVPHDAQLASPSKGTFAALVKLGAPTSADVVLASVATDSIELEASTCVCHFVALRDDTANPPEGGHGPPSHLFCVAVSNAFAARLSEQLSVSVPPSTRVVHVGSTLEEYCSSVGIGDDSSGPQKGPQAFFFEAECPGLVLVTDFITRSEEGHIVAFLQQAELASSWEILARRRVLHFHRRMLYEPPYRCGPVTTAENAAAVPAHLAALPAPPFFWDLVERLRHAPSVPSDFVCDQLTVNEYSPGGKSGIAPHVDSRVAHGEFIFSVSLNSHTVMRLRPAEPTDMRSGIDLFVPPRSLVILSGDSRHRFTHGIAEQRTDVVDPSRPPLSRGLRYSLTLRRAIDE